MGDADNQDVVPPSSPSERLQPIIPAALRNMSRTDPIPVTPPRVDLRQRCSPGDPGTDGTSPRPFLRPGRCSPGLRPARCSPGDDSPEHFRIHYAAEEGQNLSSPGEAARAKGNDDYVRVDTIETLATWEVEEPTMRAVPAPSSVVTEDPWPNGTGVLRGYLPNVNRPPVDSASQSDVNDEPASSSFQEAQGWPVPIHRDGETGGEGMSEELDDAEELGPTQTYQESFHILGPHLPRRDSRMSPSSTHSSEGGQSTTPKPMPRKIAVESTLGKRKYDQQEDREEGGSDGNKHWRR